MTDAHTDLRSAVDELFPQLVSTLGDLVRLQSVSAPGYPPARVRASAEAVAELLREAGLQGVRLLELAGAHPAVFGEIPAPPGAPTVLLYAHHDVQPPGPSEEWDTHPFEPVERHGRLYGRGTSDDKAGVVVHLGALRAHRGRLPVGVKVFVEGEEEIGSTHLPAFLEEYGDLLAADVIVIADSQNWRVGQPALTTTLRGLAACLLEVRTLRSAVHSGQFGGVFPDALTVLARTLATLHDEDGNVAIPGLAASEAPPLDLTEAELREQAGAVPGVEAIGSGSLTSRLWTKPAVSVLAIDAPPVREAINQLVPVARAKVSLRVAPQQDAKAALEALVAHLEANVPWGAEATVTPLEAGAGFALGGEGAGYESFREAMRYAWEGTDPVMMGVGGSIPFVAAFTERYPQATILLTGAADPTSAPHGPNESQHLDDLRRSVLAEAVALRLLGEGSPS